MLNLAAIMILYDEVEKKSLLQMKEQDISAEKLNQEQHNQMEIPKLKNIKSEIKYYHLDFRAEWQ